MSGPGPEEWDDPEGVWADETETDPEPDEHGTQDVDSTGLRHFAVGLTIIAAAVWLHLGGHSTLGVVVFFGLVVYDLLSQTIEAYRDAHDT